MSHKTIVKIAILMLIIFGAITIFYPTIFNPDDQNALPVEGPSSM